MAQQRLTTPIHLHHLLLETGPSVVREEKRSFSALWPHKEAALGQYSTFLSAQQVKEFFKLIDLISYLFYYSNNYYGVK